MSTLSSNEEKFYNTVKTYFMGLYKDASKDDSNDRSNKFADRNCFYSRNEARIDDDVPSENKFEMKHTEQLVSA